MVKGLKEYTEVHGKHFTEELARDIVQYKWDIDKVEKDVQGRVYYNVTGSTLGDMLYLLDIFRRYVPSQKKCVTFMLSWVECPRKACISFYMWVSFYTGKRDFDLTPYI